MQDTQHLEKQVQIVDTKVSSILQLLKGNDLDKEDKGMIGIQNDHESRIRKIEKISDRFFWFVVGLSVFAGWGVIDILQKLILK